MLYYVFMLSIYSEQTAEDYAPKLGAAAKQSIAIIIIFIASFCTALYLEAFFPYKAALIVLDITLQPVGLSASRAVLEAEKRSLAIGASFFRFLDLGTLLSGRLFTHLPAATSAFVERLLQG